MGLGDERGQEGVRGVGREMPGRTGRWVMKKEMETTAAPRIVITKR